MVVLKLLVNKSDIQKRYKEIFSTEKESLALMKKGRPKVYALLKNPSADMLLILSVSRLQTEKGYLDKKSLSKVSGIPLRNLKLILTYGTGYDTKISEIKKLAEALSVSVATLFKPVDMTRVKRSKK